MDRSSQRFRRIASHWLLTPRGLLRNPILCVDQRGTITDISQSDCIDSIEGVEFYAGILMPSMVNAHAHLELSCLAVAIESGGGFSHFAASIAEQRGRFDTKDQLRAAELEDARMWQQGVGTVGDICNGVTTFGIKAESMIVYRNFIEVYGLGVSSLDGAREMKNKAAALSLDSAITPHSTYSLNESIFKETIASDDGLLSIHFMESEGERTLYGHKGALWEWYQRKGVRIDFEKYGSPAERIVSTVPRERKLMLIHNTFVSEQEVDLLQDHFGTNLTWVLCPRSNKFIENACPPVELLRRKGVQIAIGTDSLASNASLSMVGEMAAMGDVPLEELLQWATCGGANALGISDMMEIGHRPGVVLLSGVDMDNMRLTPQSITRRIV